MKKMLLVVALLTIAGVEAKETQTKMARNARMVQPMLGKDGKTNTPKNLPQPATQTRMKKGARRVQPMLGKDGKTNTPKNLPQPKAPVKRKAARY